jgi:4-hydroxythreonine-4-phosphate dehydrogenase
MTQPAPRPVLALTLGDVAGIGPEITAKTLLQHPELRDICVPVVIGDFDAMRIGAQRAGLDPDTVRVITDPRAAANDPNVIELVQTGPSLAHIAVGQPPRSPVTALTGSSSRPAGWRATAWSTASSQPR